MKNRIRYAIVYTLASIAFICSAFAEDVSPPAIFQWFEASYQTMERRTPDLFSAGYGAVWVPPTGRAGRDGDGGFSIGYDAYDRFDLGTDEHPTRYGSESGLRRVADLFHRASADLYVDFIINHSGDRTSADADSAGNRFVDAGDYPGLVATLPNVDVDGDYHSAFAGGDIEGRLGGLLDIAQEKNHRFIRNPVPAFSKNIPAGTKKVFDRIVDQPKEENRRFYPDKDLQPILVFDPSTGEQNIKVFPFNLKSPLAGDPVEENAMGYLMRNAQWLVQVIGVDGFRIDAAKHVPGFVLDFFDRAVYRASPRQLLNGNQKHVFSFGESNFDNREVLLTYVKKTINPGEPGRIGANRDTLDFALFFRLGGNLTSNGIANDWRNIADADLDFQDDGLHNGSAGVKFVSSHDDFGPHLDNVGYAYTLMLPGNAIVYHDAKEFGPQVFPKAGRSDALGGIFGNRLLNLVGIRNTHGRGNYRRCRLEKEILAFEREGSAVVMLNNRLDEGFDERTLKVSFPSGTRLVELSGNVKDPAINPNKQVPEMVEVNQDQTINVRIPRNTGPGGKTHNSGYLIYGLQGPQSAGIELTNVDHVDFGAAPSVERNGIDRQTNIDVIKAPSFQVKLKTGEVKLLGQFLDRAAEGDNALLRVDDGLDINGNGKVDFTKPGEVTSGFEVFRDKADPRVGPAGLNAPGGDGEFVQTIDASKLSKGLHFIEVRAFRHQPEGRPPVYSSFKKVIRIE
jgi:alpha-amylase